MRGEAAALLEHQHRHQQRLNIRYINQSHSLGDMQGDFASGLDNPFLVEMARSTGKPLVQEWFSRGGSKASWETDTSPVRLALGVARMGSCVLPCPELSFLLLDFASDDGGRLDVGVIGAILRRVCNLDFAAARKILYAQHLVAGQLQEPGGVRFPHVYAVQAPARK